MSIVGLRVRIPLSVQAHTLALTQAVGVACYSASREEMRSSLPNFFV